MRRREDRAGVVDRHHDRQQRQAGRRGETLLEIRARQRSEGVDRLPGRVRIDRLPHGESRWRTRRVDAVLPVALQRKADHRRQFTGSRQAAVVLDPGSRQAPAVTHHADRESDRAPHSMEQGQRPCAQRLRPFERDFVTVFQHGGQRDRPAAGWHRDGCLEAGMVGAGYAGQCRGDVGTFGAEATGAARSADVQTQVGDAELRVHAPPGKTHKAFLSGQSCRRIEARAQRCAGHHDRARSKRVPVTVAATHVDRNGVLARRQRHRGAETAGRGTGKMRKRRGHIGPRRAGQQFEQFFGGAHANRYRCIIGRQAPAVDLYFVFEAGALRWRLDHEVQGRRLIDGGTHDLSPPIRRRLRPSRNQRDCRSTASAASRAPCA